MPTALFELTRDDFFYELETSDSRYWASASAVLANGNEVRVWIESDNNSNWGELRMAVFSPSGATSPPDPDQAENSRPERSKVG